MSSKYIDLHLHIDGSISVDNAKQLAVMQGIEIPETDEEILQHLTVDSSCRDLNAFLEKFDFPCSLLQTSEALVLATQNLLLELALQGVEYAELRFAPQKHTEKGLSQKEVVQSVLRGMEHSPIPTNLILCCLRGDNLEKENLETVEQARRFLGKGVVALDLAGAEALFPTNQFQSIFQKAIDYGIPFTLHAGEAAGPESIWQAIHMGACRIGHGIRAIEDPKLVQYLIDHQIPLECCPTSNRCTCVFPETQEYPFKELLKKGVLVTVNTDDMAVCGTTMEQEMLLLGLTEKEQEMVYQNAKMASFADEHTKQRI